MLIKLSDKQGYDSKGQLAPWVQNNNNDNDLQKGDGISYLLKVFRRDAKNSNPNISIIIMTTEETMILNMNKLKSELGLIAKKKLYYRVN